MNKINLQGAWNKIIELGYKPYYLGLYGSQNYNIHTEKSDVDYKCIIMPTLEDLVNQTKPISKTIDFEGGQIDLKDIRTYIESAVKVNINFIEILSTKYWIGDGEIRKFFNPLLNEMGGQYLRACYGMLEQKYHALEHPFPSKEYEIKTFGYDPKQLCHIVRLNLLMNRYLKGDYSYIHNSIEARSLLKIKSGYRDLEWARKTAIKTRELAKKLVDEYKGVDTYINKKLLIQFSRDIIIKNIKDNIKNNL